MTYKVNAKLEFTSKDTLEDILVTGSKDDILSFIENQSKLESDDLSKVYWLLNDKAFYLKIVDILRRNGVYDAIVWKYSIYHKDEQSIKEYFDSTNNIKNKLYPSFTSKLIEVDDSINNDNRFFMHLEYYPLINSRIHSFSASKLDSSNVEFQSTYYKFIIRLIRMEQITSKDWLKLCYYLITQEKLEDAMKVFTFIDKKSFIKDFSSLEMQ